MVTAINERRLPEFSIESLRGGAACPPKSDLRMEMVAKVINDIHAIVHESYKEDAKITTWAYLIDWKMITPTLLGMVIDHLKKSWKSADVVGDHIVISTLDTLVPPPLPEPLASEVRRQAEQSAPVEDEAKAREPVHA